MRVLFIGLSPGPQLERTLIEGGAEIFQDQAPTGSLLDLVVARANPAANGAAVADALHQLRDTYPHAWITIVCSRRKLEQSEYCRRLLRCTAQDDVWTEGSWRALFWLSLQRAQREQRLRTQLRQVRADLHQAALQPLSRKTNRLVRQLERDIELATHIQRSFLPKMYPQIPGVMVAAKYLPAAGVGGDYYDIFEFGDRRRFGILLADSKTHGMAAALLACLLKIRLEEMKDRFPDSLTFLAHLHEELHAIDPATRASLSVLYGILDRLELTFQYTVAGNLRPMLWRQGGEAPLDYHPGSALGENESFDGRESRIALVPGDLLLLHTDGLSQVAEGLGMRLSDELPRLLQAEGATPDPVHIQAGLMGLVHRHREQAELRDDVTLLQFAVAPRALYLSHSR